MATGVNVYYDKLVPTGKDTKVPQLALVVDADYMTKKSVKELRKREELLWPNSFLAAPAEWQQEKIIALLLDVQRLDIEAKDAIKEK
jgi:hypothetical protein